MLPKNMAAIGWESLIATSWMDDPGKRGRRIFYGWWNQLHQIEDCTLKFFWQAVQTIATNQASSASSERTFSQLNFTVRTFRSQAMEEMIETWLMLRLNCCHEMDYYAKCTAAILISCDIY